MTIGEVLMHLFFQLVVYGIWGLLVWATWDTDNLLLMGLTLLASLIAWRVSRSESVWIRNARQKIDEDEPKR